MSWYQDMGHESMVAVGDHVRAVGWLSSACPFPRGELPAEFVTRLLEFVRRADHSSEVLGFPAFGGWHDCEFCGQARGYGNFGVPSGPLLFVAPEMLGHYVQQHEYAPPPEFVAAVLSSPLPGTPEYQAATAEFSRRHQEWWDSYFKRLQARVEQSATARGGHDPGSL